MHHFVSLAVYYGLILSSGWLILSYLTACERMSFGETFALSYGIGMGAVSVETFFFMILGARVRPYALFLPWCVLFLLAAATRRLRVPGLRRVAKERLSGLEKFLLLGISFEVAYAFFRAVLYPMEAYDTVAIWAIKAKAIYLARGLPIEFFKNVNYLDSHFDYPLLIPIQEAVFYFICGGVRDALAKSIFPMYLAAFLILFYSALTRFLDRRRSLLFTFLLGTIPQFKEFATNGYADFVVSFYYAIGFLFLYRWLTEGGIEPLFLSGVFSAMCAWTKNEGYPLGLLNLCIALMIASSKTMGNGKRRLSDTALGISVYLLAMAIFVVPWEAFKASLGITSDLFVKETSSVPRALKNLARLPLIAYEYQKQFFGFKKWNLVWVLFLSGLVLNFKKAFSGKLYFITLSLLGSLGVYTVVYILTPKDFGWHLSTTASRLFIHIVPLAVFWLAVLCKELAIDL